MNPKGPGTKTLTLPIVAAVAILLLWLWFGKDAACSRLGNRDVVGANGLVRLPFEPRDQAPAYPASQVEEEEEVELPDDSLPDWKFKTRLAGSFGAAPDYFPPPYVSPPLEPINPPPGYVVYSGFVIDAWTRMPIMGAHIHIETAQGRYGSNSISTGEFALLVSDDPATCEITAKGYFPARYGQANTYLFGTIALTPIGETFTLKIVDRWGKRIPDCSLTVLDIYGKPAAASTLTPSGFYAHQAEISVKSGEVTFAGMNPGHHNVLLGFEDQDPLFNNFQIPRVHSGELRLQLDLSVAEIHQRKKPIAEQGADR